MCYTVCTRGALCRPATPMTPEEFEKKPWYTLTNTIRVPLIELSIGHCGYEIKEKDELVTDHYPAYRLHYIVRGGLYLFAGGRTQYLPAHTCFMLCPDLDNNFRTDLADPAAHYWISFNGQKARDYVTQMGFSAETPAIAVPEAYRGEVRDAFYNCLNFPKNQIRFTDYVFLENFMRIVRILSVISDSGSRQTKKAPVYIEQALSYFEEHFTEPDFTVRSVAQALFIHENYLSAIFKAHFGISFKRYLDRRRTDLALSLIEQGYTSVSRIGEMVGIPDPSYFSKFFKRENGGCLPSEEMRKKHNKHAPPREPLRGRKPLTAARRISPARFFFPPPSLPRVFRPA